MLKKNFLILIVVIFLLLLIVTPICIKVSKRVFQPKVERSIELYGSSIKKAVSDYSMRNNGIIPTYIELNKYLNDHGKSIKDYYEGNVSCTDTIINRDGSVYLSNCKVEDVLVSNFNYGEYKGI